MPKEIFKNYVLSSNLK